MATDRPMTCRLCRAALRTEEEQQRRLCAVCDEYAQHVALAANQQLDRVVTSLEQGPLFQAASRRTH